MSCSMTLYSRNRKDHCRRMVPSLKKVTLCSFAVRQTANKEPSEPCVRVNPVGDAEFRRYRAKSPCWLQEEGVALPICNRSDVEPLPYEHITLGHVHRSRGFVMKTPESSQQSYSQSLQWPRNKISVTFPNIRLAAMLSSDSSISSAHDTVPQSTQMK